MNQLDHIVIAAPDLDAAKQEFADRTRVTPIDGGQHVGRGTRNALVSFGAGQYLEIIAPDPEQDIGDTFGAALAGLSETRLLHWAVRVSGLEAVAEVARAAGFEPGPIFETSRAQADGVVLNWKLMGVGGHDAGGFVPFYIDWLDCPHPADTSVVVGPLTVFELHLPADDPARQLLAGTDNVTLEAGSRALTVRFDSPGGPVEYSADGSLPGFSF